MLVASFLVRLVVAATFDLDGTCVGEQCVDVDVLLQTGFGTHEQRKRGNYSTKLNTDQLAINDTVVNITRGPDLYWDGFNQMQTYVQQMQHQFAAEMFFSWKLSENGISVNGTHILFPMGAKVQGDYIRRMNGLGDEEVGVVISRCNMQNPVMPAALSPDATVACAEKMHGYERKKPLDMTAYDRAQSYNKSLLRTDDIETRHYYTTLAASLATPGMQITQAAGVPNQEIKDWGVGDVPLSMKSASTAIKSDMQKAFAKLKRQGANLADPLVSLVNCFHWDDVAFDEATKKIVFPLNKKISAYRGQTAISPFVSLEALQGTSFWSFDTRAQRVELFLGVSLSGHMPDPESEDPQPSMIYLAPKDGVGNPVAHKGEVHVDLSAGAKAYAVKLMNNQKFNRNFTFLLEDPEKLCPPSKVQKVQHHLEQILEMVEGGLLHADPNGVQKLHELYAKTVIEILPCVTDYLKPDHLNAAEYNYFMSNALSHGVMELPVGMIISTFGARDWNVINETLIGPY